MSPVDPLGVRLARSLMNAQSGGFLATPPGLDGDPGLGIAGVSGAPRSSEWDAVVSVEAPDIPGDEVHFVTLEDGTVVVDEAVPDGCLAPLADAVERELRPPYRAEAARHEHDVWAVGATRVAVATLPGTVDGDVIELTSYGGERSCSIDGRPCEPFRALEILGEQVGPDFALRADRLDESTWVVDCKPL